MIEEVLQFVQVLFIVAVAPLITGIIRIIKARMQSRRGPPLFQPYYDLAKLFRKDSVVSKDASWLTSITPYVCMSAVITAAFLVPVFISSTFGFIGDLIVVVYLFAMVRFFMALAAMDAGSTFGGMGSSREMTISSIVEPTILLSIFAMALVTGTTVLASISHDIAVSGMNLVTPSLFLAAAAFFVATLAENARIPVDNPATHLELTMIHEGMILEYSGKQLALMELSSMIKLVLFFTILSNVFFPWGIATSIDALGISIGIAAFILKIVSLAAVVALVESSISKLRLFKLPNLLTVAFMLSLLAVLSYYILGGP